MRSRKEKKRRRRRRWGQLQEGKNQKLRAQKYPALVSPKTRKFWNKGRKVIKFNL